MVQSLERQRIIRSTRFPIAIMNSRDNPYQTTSKSTLQRVPETRRRLSVVSVIVIVLCTCASFVVAFCCTCIPLGVMTFGAFNSTNSPAGDWVFFIPWGIGLAVAGLVCYFVCLWLSRALASEVPGIDPSESRGATPDATPVEQSSGKPDASPPEHRP